jgi:hypothetical protein
MDHGVHKLVLDIHKLSSSLRYLIFALISMVDYVLVDEVASFGLFETLCCIFHIQIDL